MTHAAPDVLRVEGVDAGYERQRVLYDVSFHIAPGMRVGLIGPNGAGKTTLFRVALGLLRPSAGSVSLFGLPIDRVNRRADPVAYLPQLRDLNREFPILAREVVAQGRVGKMKRFGRTRPEDRDAVTDALEKVDLLHVAETSFLALSGGQQQRILLARALATQARLILLDEPVTGIDATTRDLVERILDDLVAEGVAVFISTHDLHSGSLDRFDWLIALNGGIVEQGPPREVICEGLWQRLFSGMPAAAVA